MSCSRFIIARIVDSTTTDDNNSRYNADHQSGGASSDNSEIINVLLDKVFDHTADASQLTCNPFCSSSSSSSIMICHEFWRRVKISLMLGNVHLANGTADSSFFLVGQQCGVWRSAPFSVREAWKKQQEMKLEDEDDDDSNGTDDDEDGSDDDDDDDEFADTSIQRDPVCLYQFHSISETNHGLEFVATVAIAFHSSSPSSLCKISPQLFELSNNKALLKLFSSTSSNGESRNSSSSSSVQQIDPNLRSPVPNIEAASLNLLRQFSEQTLNDTLGRSIRYVLDEVINDYTHYMNGGSSFEVIGGNNSTVSNNNDSRNQQQQQRLDPWLTILEHPTNPSFSSLTDYEIQKINTLLVSFVSQRLAFGAAGGSSISRPFTSPLQEILASSSQQNQQQVSSLLFPSIVVVDIISREVTESAIVIRDCSEVWCDVPKTGRLPTIVSGSSGFLTNNNSGGGNKNLSNNNNNFGSTISPQDIGRRLGVVALDWSFVDTEPKKSSEQETEEESRHQQSLQRNASFANSNAAFSSATFATHHNKSSKDASSRIVLTKQQQRAAEWSSLRRNHSSIEENGAVQSLPWTSAPPRSVGPMMVYESLENAKFFTSFYEAALTRTSKILYSIHPKQVSAIRGLRTIMFDISPSALLNSKHDNRGLPLNKSWIETSSTRQNSIDAEAEDSEEIARAGARWVSRRYGCSSGSQNRKMAENQTTAFKKTFISDAQAVKSYNQGDGCRLKNSTFSALKDDPSMPFFKRVARMMNQQPRCLIAGQDDQQNCGNIGVKSRLLVSPQVLKPVVKQVGRRLFLECTFKFVVQFSAPTIVTTIPNSSGQNNNNNSFGANNNNSFGANNNGGLSNTSFSSANRGNAHQQQMKVATESLQAFQVSDSSINFNGNEIDCDNNNNNSNVPKLSLVDGNPSSSDNNNMQVGNKKLCLDSFRAVITGNSITPQVVAPSQNPVARDGAVCAFHDIQLKSSISGTNIVASKLKKPAVGVVPSSSTSNKEKEKNTPPPASSTIVWSFPSGTIVNLNEDISLTGKVSLETQWPDERTASSIADLVRGHSARPFPMPPIHAQLEFLGFVDGDFSSQADDVSMTGSHVDAFSATSIKRTIPNDQLMLPSSSSSASSSTSNITTTTATKWKSFNDGLRNLILSASAPASQQNNNNINNRQNSLSSSLLLSSCLLCSTTTSFDGDEQEDSLANKMNTKLETLLPDWPSAFSTQHLSAAAGSQLSEILQQGIFASSNSNKQSQQQSSASPRSQQQQQQQGDYSNLVVPSPKARMIACGPQFGSNFIVWNGRN